MGEHARFAKVREAKTADAAKHAQTAREFLNKTPPQYKEAHASLSAAIDLLADADMFLQRSVCNLHMGKFQAANTDALSALKLKPVWPEALAQFAAALEKQFLFKLAVEALTEAVRRAPATSKAKFQTLLQAAKKKLAAHDNRGFDYQLDSDPTEAYHATKAKQVVMPSPIDHGTTPKKPGMVRFVCISDTHGLQERLTCKIPDGDVLIHAGDFTNTGELKQIQAFSKWINTLPHKYKIVIAGNHDITLHPSYYKTGWRRFHSKRYDVQKCKAAMTNFTYLEDEATTVCGYRVYGSPWQPEFCQWAFNLTRGPECRSAWEQIPSDTEILITHGPPLGHGDRCMDEQRAGCADLLRTVQQRVRPLYHIFGHIHEGYGQTTDGHTQYINASTCDGRYRPGQAPVVFDLPLREGVVVDKTVGADGDGAKAAAAAGSGDGGSGSVVAGADAPKNTRSENVV